MVFLDVLPGTYPLERPMLGKQRISRLRYGVTVEEVLIMWIERNKGSKIWMEILNELKNRETGGILLTTC